LASGEAVVDPALTRTIIEKCLVYEERKEPSGTQKDRLAVMEMV
jgi:hypothetical protein